LENHAAIVSALGKGTVNLVTTTGEKRSFNVEGGFLEMLNNEVALLVANATEA
jgi:F0F1-type ATP synthase epsilon subunit